MICLGKKDKTGNHGACVCAVFEFLSGQEECGCVRSILSKSGSEPPLPGGGTRQTERGAKAQRCLSNQKTVWLCLVTRQ